MAKAVYWSGRIARACEVCHDPITTQFVDGKTILGPWAFLCLKCHGNLGCGLGPGRGQRYERQPDDRWLKVEG